MHIGIDARMYGPRHGGIGRYVEQLITHLLDIDPTQSYTLFALPHTIPEHIAARATVVETTIPWYSISEQILLPQLLKKHPVDLMHFPHWNVPLIYNKPFVVTIHDLILIHHPDRRASTLNPIWYNIKYAAFKKILNHAAHASSHILTVSDFSKQDLVNTLHIDPQKISTTHLGVDHLKSSNTRSPHHKPFMLAVGVQYPHKNLEFLVDMFTALQKQNTKNYDLIITGPRGPFSEQLEQKVHEANTTCAQEKNGRIICTFNQPDAIIQSYYEHAKIFLFPSKYEGFGLPPLEAMRAHTPVIASNTSSIPEITGGAAHLADPHNIETWIDAIDTITNDKIHQESLIKKGNERLKTFNWDTCASSTHKAYENYTK